MSELVQEGENMSYCNGLCEHLNEKRHKCELTGEKLTYIKGWRGITHEHRGNLDCDKSEQNDSLTR